MGSPAQATNGGAAGTSDAFIVSFSTTDVPTYSSYHGGTGNETGLVVDASLANGGAPYYRAYIAGSTTGGTFPVLNAASFQATYGGGSRDGFVARYDFDSGTGLATRTWSSFHGGTGDDRIRCIYPMSNHAVFFAEETNSSTYTVCPSSPYTYSGLMDIFYFGITDFTSIPVFQKGIYLGSATGNESPWDIAPLNDGSGNVYLVGETTGASFQPIIPTAATCDYDQAAYAGTMDGFIMLVGGCTVSWSTYYGGTASDWIMGASLDNNGCLYFGGELHSTTLGSPTEIFNPGLGAYYQATSGGAHEQMFGKLCSCPTANAGPNITRCCPSGTPVLVNQTPVPCFSYSWSPTTGLSSSTIANPTVSVATSGTITYTLTVTNTVTGCSSTDIMVRTVNASCCRIAASDSSASGSFYEIYPNPTQNEVAIQFNPGASIGTVEVFDVNGRVIDAHQTQASDKITLSFADEPTGVYIVRMKINGKVYVERIIKED